MTKKLTLGTRQLCDKLSESWGDMEPVDKCMNLLHLKNGTRLSERELAFCFKLSKSEIHRMISVAGLSEQMRSTCKEFGTDYHVLCLFAEAASSERKEELRERIVNGSIRRHKAAREFLGPSLRVGRKRAEVVIKLDNRIECLHCGKWEIMTPQEKGVDVAVYIEHIREWSKPHRSCRRVL